MKVPLEPKVDALTERVIAAAFAVSNTLGHGFLKLVYRNALVEELIARDIHGVIEKSYPVHYRGKVVGRYVADLVVEDTVIVELKAVDALTMAHRAQVLNYLRASERAGCRVAFQFRLAENTNEAGAPDAAGWATKRYRSNELIVSVSHKHPCSSGIIRVHPCSSPNIGCQTRLV